MSNYKWQESICCISVYNILENDNLMDQFEKEEVSFQDAKTLKMENLNYYMHTTNNGDILDLMSHGVARKFIQLLAAYYVVKKEKKSIKSASIYRKVAKVFRAKDSTLLDLAEVVDANIKFTDE
ncbi:MAG: hypothetical protein ACI88H_001445 [Cocleimonas sp.]|jgi:hypothetical protein